ncbi:MAG: FAD-binding oxidoreductase [Fimbriimonadales bacterium]|nr:FAD-binding oxidoreductase [Fimbriimonadales bacterium]
MREGLYAIVGSAGIGGDTTPYQIGDAAPAAVVMPAAEAEVCALLEYAQGMRAPCVVAGSGTHLTALTPPDRAWWLLSTRRLNRVIDYSPQDLVLTVGAGMTLQAVQALMREHNQYLPWNPALPDRATIGGIVAANRAGSWRYRYGTPRDRLLAVRAVRTDGVAFKSGAKVVKSVAGYDLHRLLCGSWGTLAVITEITLKVQPLPQQFDAVGWFTTWQELEPTLAELMRMPIQPDGISVVALRGSSLQSASRLRAVSAVSEAYPAGMSGSPSIGVPSVLPSLPTPSPTAWERGKLRGEVTSPLPSNVSPLPPRGRGAGGEGTTDSNPATVAPVNATTVVEPPPRGRIELWQSLAHPQPETQFQFSTDIGAPAPYILLEFSGRPEGVAWQIRYLRERGYPAEPVSERQLAQLRDWLAPRTHALMLQLMLRPSEVADAMARWTELRGVSALAHAGNGVLYLAVDEEGLHEALVQRVRTLQAKYRVLSGADWLRAQTGGELPRLPLSEGERRLMQGIKHALDARNILPTLV